LITSPPGVSTVHCVLARASPAALIDELEGDDRGAVGDGDIGELRGLHGTSERTTELPSP
jgi:hypothetical protein